MGVFRDARYMYYYSCLYNLHKKCTCTYVHSTNSFIAKRSFVALPLNPPKTYRRLSIIVNEYWANPPFSLSHNPLYSNSTQVKVSIYWWVSLTKVIVPKSMAKKSLQSPFFVELVLSNPTKSEFSMKFQYLRRSRALNHTRKTLVLNEEEVSSQLYLQWSMSPSLQNIHYHPIQPTNHTKIKLVKFSEMLIFSESSPAHD